MIIIPLAFHTAFISRTLHTCKNQFLLLLLTAEYHHADDEHLLVLAVGGDVAESDTRHAGQREVERRGVRHAAWWSASPRLPVGFIVAV